MGRQRGRTRERREDVSDADKHKPGFIHLCCVATDAETGEDDISQGDADPAIEDDGAAGGDQDDGIPFWAVDAGPGVGLHGEHGVLIQDVGLDGENNNEEDDCEDKQAQEAGFVQAG